MKTLDQLKAGDTVWHYGLHATGDRSTWEEATVEYVTPTAINLTNGKSYCKSDGLRIHSESFMPDWISTNKQEYA